MEQNRIQLRGVCQCCGREQAVIKGKMSKHGYTVDNGWFNGVCIGQYFEPMQFDITQTVEIVRQIRTEIATLTIRLAAVRAGTLKPVTLTDGTKFEDARDFDKFRAVKTLENSLVSRIDSGEFFADHLEKMASEFFRKPLLEVTITPRERIFCGEKRKGPRGVMTVQSISGSKIRWIDERGFKGSTHSGTWRKFEEVEQ